MRGSNPGSKKLNFTGIEPRFKKVELYWDQTQVQKKLNFTGIEPRFKKVELYGLNLGPKKLCFTGIEPVSEKIPGTIIKFRLLRIC